MGVSKLPQVHYGQRSLRSGDIYPDVVLNLQLSTQYFCTDSDESKVERLALPSKVGVDDTRAQVIVQYLPLRDDSRFNFLVWLNLLLFLC